MGKNEIKKCPVTSRFYRWNYFGAAIGSNIANQKAWQWA